MTQPGLATCYWNTIARQWAIADAAASAVVVVVVVVVVFVVVAGVVDQEGGRGVDACSPVSLQVSKSRMEEGWEAGYSRAFQVSRIAVHG